LVRIFSHGYFMRYYLFFMGRMEYARLIIISSSVGDLHNHGYFMRYKRGSVQQKVGGYEGTG